MIDSFQINTRSDGTFSVILKLPNGTHRMRFVVDNELRCSDFLPSATDSMGNLVNYIEVPSESEAYYSHDGKAPTSTQHRGSVPSDDRAVEDDESMAPLQKFNSQGHPVDHPPGARLTRATTSEKVESYDMTNDDELLNGGGYERFQEEMPSEPVLKFTSEIPKVFTDPEEMEQFVASDFVTPPQLPPHLESVILNSNSNEKDNNSVLPIPNHVVLNHLATTSIKHNVLAVASISRYSRKYVTQILYAPL